MIYNFEDVAMLPEDGDNCAMAKRLLPKGSTICLSRHQREITLKAPCLEGHRFCIQFVAIGKSILSWNLPFGHALHDLMPGEVLLNAKTATALSGRLVHVHGRRGDTCTEEQRAIQELLKPSNAVNFEDLDVSPDSPFVLEDHGYTAVGMNATTATSTGTFMGYRRPHGRGVGTRNHVAIIALTASASPLLVPLQNKWRNYNIDGNSCTFDGVRIVAHTEGESTKSHLNNARHIHRCLAGFLVHMNVGAAIVVTTGRERHLSKATLLQFVRDVNRTSSDGHGPIYPPQCFEEPFCQWVNTGSTNTTAASTTAHDHFHWQKILDTAVQKAVTYATKDTKREACPLSELTIALQCGGSDSFSGLTGNPLAGAIAAHFIQEHASRAILAESPELVGAEPYILSRVASQQVAQDFIRTTEHYKAYGARHGLSVAGNPSGGNLYRGLYNIVLKSLGAARKKPPSIALDVVLPYGEPIKAHCHEARILTNSSGVPPHYAFMDSPGNDLESIAGQVASGCNLIIFITGNGAMTNFPFVPTLKVVTTTKRYELLQHEMDINGGPYGNGGEERIDAVNYGVDLCLKIASGERSKGEAAGHSQVSIWRNWDVDENDENLGTHKNFTSTSSAAGADEDFILCTKVEPYLVRTDPPPFPDSLLQIATIERRSKDGTADVGTSLRPWSDGASLALIPTSLCSSAVAASFKDPIAETIRAIDKNKSFSNHVVCPSHTEGCGAAGDSTYQHRYQRMILGHALHASVARTIFLEHGCEKTHNDFFRCCIQEAGVLLDDDNIDDGIDDYLSFCSLQGGGGYDNAKKKVTEYLCGIGGQTKKAKRDLFGIPWSSRPISVGLLVDPAVFATVDAEEGSILASKLGYIVRYLSQLHVHAVLPETSPLFAPRSPEEMTVAEGRDSRHSLASVGTQPPSATGDMEDFFVPTSPKNKKKAKVSPDPPLPNHRPISVQFAVEALLDATVPRTPTMLAGQMIEQRKQNAAGGLHVMEIPEGASWDETISCLSPACDVMLVIAHANEISLLPGSCLVPTLRRATPSPHSDKDRPQAWHQWAIGTCRDLVEILQSPLVAGGKAEDSDELASLQKSLFSLTTFVVPRGPSAVSF